MEITISSSELQKHLSTISGVVTSNPILPILDNFLFDITNEKLSISASDLQTFLTTSLKVDGSEQNVKICVPAKILIEILKSLPNQPITIIFNSETFSMEIKSLNGKYKLACENAEDYPEFPNRTANQNIEIKSELLKKSLSTILFATGTDMIKPELCGIYLNIDQDGMTFVASNGHKLARYILKDNTSTSPISCIIPKKPLSIINNHPTPVDSTFDLSFNESFAIISFDNFTLITRLVDEIYPPYNNVLPDESSYTLELEHEDLLNSIKRISIFANKTTKQIKFKISKDKLKVFTKDKNFANEASEDIKCNFNGDDDFFEVDFNYKFLLEILNVVDTDEVVFHLEDSRRAVLVFPKSKEKNEDLLLLIMPIVLKEKASIEVSAN